MSIPEDQGIDFEGEKERHDVDTRGQNKAGVDSGAPHVVLDAQHRTTPFTRLSYRSTNSTGFKLAFDELNLVVMEGRALQLFKACDLSGTGMVGVSELEVALMMHDVVPTTSYLTPLDSFNVFDLDGGGDISWVEFKVRKNGALLHSATCFHLTVSRTTRGRAGGWRGGRQRGGRVCGLSLNCDRCVRTCRDIRLRLVKSQPPTLRAHIIFVYLL